MMPRGLLTPKEMEALMGLFDRETAGGAEAARPCTPTEVGKMVSVMQQCSTELAERVGAMTKQPVQALLKSIRRPQPPIWPHRQSLYRVQTGGGMLLLLCPDALLNLLNEAALGGRAAAALSGHRPTAIDRRLFETTGARLAGGVAHCFGSEAGTLELLETLPHLARPIEVCLGIELPPLQTSLTLLLDEGLFEKSAGGQSV